MRKSYWKYFGVLLLILIIFFLLYPQKQLLENCKSDLIQVDIIIDPNIGGKNIEYNISDLDSMTKLFEAVCSITTFAKKHPNHSETNQSDGQYTVTFKYKGGIYSEIDISKGTAYRYLNTVGSGGDRGYVYGNAEPLIHTIDAIISQN